MMHALVCRQLHLNARQDHVCMTNIMTVCLGSVYAPLSVQSMFGLRLCSRTACLTKTDEVNTLVQEVLLILEECWNNSPELHNVPIYQASGLARRAISVYQT